MAQEFWRNSRTKTVVEIQVGGPGNAWKPLSLGGDILGGSIDAPSGGGRGAESEWGRDSKGRSIAIGTNRTGNPERVTATLSARIQTINFINGLLEDKERRCESGCDEDNPSIRVRHGCGSPQDRIDFDKIVNLIDVVSTSPGYSDPLSDEAEGTESIVMQTESLSALFELRQAKLSHNAVTSSLGEDVALNRIIYKCDEEWWAIGDSDTTPGYAGTGAPRVYWTTDDGSTWNSVPIGVFLDANGTAIQIVGNTVVVGTDSGIATAGIRDIKTWNAAKPNPFSLRYSTNAPNDIVYISGDVLRAVCDSGIILKSIDAGNTWTIEDNGVATSDNLQRVHFADEDLGVACGANGAFLRFTKGAWEAFTVDATLSAVTLNDVAIPPRRNDECIVVTANGEVWHTGDLQADGVDPTFTERSIPQQGQGSVVAVEFAGYQGAVMFLLQQEVDLDTRVLVDYSGGACGPDLDIVGDFQTPANNGINDIAAATANFAMTVGETISSNGFVGKVS